MTIRATTRRLTDRLEELGKPVVYCSCLILIGLISYLRYWTGPEYAFSIFYFFPIVIITWNAGPITGGLFALLSALAWLTADLRLIHTFSALWVPFLNETFRLLVFLIIVILVWRLKTALRFQEKLARTDPLTGIANRRAFMEFATLELKRARRFNLPLTLLCMDADNFKFVNDHHGHHGGDRLLKTVARTIAANIRSTDMAARLGGDEFCILFSGTGEKSAGKIADKISGRLSVLMRDNDWPVTFSSGMATYENPPAGVDEMLRIVDDFMYQAKKAGKNNLIHRVVR